MKKVKNIFALITSLNLLFNAVVYAGAENTEDKKETAIQKAISVTDDEMTDLEKALAVHEYIVLNCSFDNSHTKYTAYDCLVGKSAVCLGYAEAYKEILNRLDIECEVVISREMNHAWNYVKINDNWYHTDVTWDDALSSDSADVYGQVLHDNFMLSDEGISNTDPPHYGWEVNVLPKADDNAYDDFFWKDVDSGIFKINELWHYIENEKRYPFYYDGKLNQMLSYIKSYDFSTGDSQKVYTIASAWYVWKEDGTKDSYYITAFAKLAVYDGMLFFNTADSIYNIDADGLNVKRIKKRTKKDGYIYGIKVSDNVLKYAVKKNPSEYGTIYSKTLA